MNTRRRFLAGLAAGILSPRILFGGESGKRRTRWEMMMYDGEPSASQLVPHPQEWSNDTFTAAWVGHATVLINFFGTWIITDPVFSERIGLNVANLFTIGPRRLVLPALQYDELPPIDLVLVSHAHMDHLDTPSITKFPRETPLVIAKHTFDVVEDYGFQSVYELDWGEFAEIGSVRVEALQVKHFGWRYPWETDRSRGNPEGRSYNAYLVSKNGRHFVFGGDSAYQEFFKSLTDRNLTIDVAIMPIGAYDPWIQNHCTPEQALAMTDHMRARHILPIHWNTFIQSEEPTAEPMQRLKAAAAHQPHRVVLESVGQTWAMQHTAGFPAVQSSSKG